MLVQLECVICSNKPSKRSPCIIFIDELDALGKTRGSGQIGGTRRTRADSKRIARRDGWIRLEQWCDCNGRHQPARNALIQPCCVPDAFDRHVLVDRPDITGREEILEVHLKNIRVGEDVVVKRVAAITSGFVGADLANIVNEAALLAARNGKKAVGMEELNEAVERTSAGLEKKKTHHAGRRKTACRLPREWPCPGGLFVAQYRFRFTKFRSSPRGLAALGYTMQRPEQDRFLMTQGELESRIKVLLGGTVAEELVFEDISSGAQNDLERATEIARSMVMDFGMSRLGRVNYRESNRSPFLATGGDMPRMQSHSEETAERLMKKCVASSTKGWIAFAIFWRKRRAALDATSATPH